MNRPPIHRQVGKDNPIPFSFFTIVSSLGREPFESTSLLSGVRRTLERGSHGVIIRQDKPREVDERWVSFSTRVDPDYLVI